MDLTEAMTTNGTNRFYTNDPVPDSVLLDAITAARFGPQGGNRQPVRFIIVKDEEKKAKMAEWYRVPWKAYMEGARSGQIDIGGSWKVVENADYFADHLQEVPAIVVVCARLEDLHPTDDQLGRLSIVGGCSVYPTVQNFLLKCREHGVATSLTTLLCIYEPQVRELLEIPDEYITACHIAVGYPARGFPTKLNRMPVSEMAFVDSFGAAFPGA